MRKVESTLTVILMKVTDRNKFFFDAQTLLSKREVLGVYVFQYVHYARPHL